MKCLPVGAASGEEALLLLREALDTEKAFQLVLAEPNLPGMNVFDLAERIRASENMKNLPIIALADNGRMGDGQKCKDVDGYLTRIVKMEELENALTLVLDLSHKTEGLAASKPITRHTIAEECRNEIQILVVEDYPANQQILTKHLETAGYNADIAGNGLEALDAFKKKPYDLIFMDIQMPQMDGFEATETIRNLEALSFRANMESSLERPKKVPIIAMTAQALKNDRDIYIEAGMDDYIAKPFVRRDLLAMVEKWALPSRASGNLDSREFQVRNPAPRKTAIVCAEPINFSKAIEEFEGDEPLLMEVLTGFIENVGEQIDILRLALSESDTNCIQKEAHTIKGGASNLTADALSKAALELENIGSSGNLERGTEVLARLDEEFDRLKAFALKKKILG